MIYGFNAAGWLTRQQDGWGNQIQITRNASNLITQITNPAGQSLTFSYITARRGSPTSTYSVISAITDPLGRVVRYTYYPLSDGRLATVTDP